MKWNLYTGGKFPTGTMKVLALSGGVTQIFPGGGWQYLPYSAFTVGSYSLDSDGWKFISAPAGQTIDVTPHASPNYYLGSAGVETPLVKIYDANTNDLTQGTNTVVVGQQINLQCQLVNCPRSTTNFQWTIPGFAISNYVVSADTSSAIVVTNFPTNGTSVSFYWVDGATNRKVTCSAVVSGQTIVGQAVFNVLRPTADWTAEPDAVVAIDNNYKFSPALHYGYYNSTNQGMLFHFRNPDVKGYQGESWKFEWAQLANSYIRGDYIISNNLGFVQYKVGLDTAFPAGWWTEPIVTGDQQDSPGVLASGLFKVTLQETFTNYLMFQATNPIVGTYIPVPIKEIIWSWGGTATNNGSSWLLLTSPNNFSVILNDADTLNFPTWNQNATNATLILTNWF